MPVFTPFKKATGADTPNFINAAYFQAKLAQEQEDRERAREDQTITGGLDLYDKFTGKNTPIMDALTGGGGSVVPEAADLSGALRAASGTGAGGTLPLAMNPALTGGAVADLSALGIPAAMNPAITGNLAGATGLGAGASALPVATSVIPAIEGTASTLAAAGAGGAAGGGAMAAMGPIGIALALASLLGLF